MAWWIWMVIIIAAVILVIDWLIVMGADPRKWKGGVKEFEHGGIRRESDHDSEG